MAVLITVEAVAIALLALLVAGLLRSHAEILRALHDAGIDTGHHEPVARSRSHVPTITRRAEGGRAADVVGVSPDGEAIVVGVVGAPHDTALAFLTTGCITCASFWREFAERGASALGARSVIVTKGATEESLSKVRELAPNGVPVVMSSEAWTDYDVPGAPYFVYVEGPAGRIRGEGTASSWDQLASLLRQASDDRVIGGNRVARTDAEREARADRELLAAGYQPGDPRLHPEPGSPAGG
jgi:hypothetical protein